MANYYRILSAVSASGEDLQIPIHWDFDKLSDLSVLIADQNGKVSPCDYWSWNSSLNQIEIENTKNYPAWAAYVSRKEDASTLLQLVEGFIVNPQNIVAQFEKTNRVIEAMQQDAKTALRAPDYISGYLPNASGRKGRFLSFDENGAPNCEIGTDEFSDAKNSTSQAMEAANLAREKAEAAQNAAEFAKGVSERGAVSAGISAANAAQSAEDSIIAKGLSEDARNSAEIAQEKAEIAQGKAELAQGKAEIARDSAQAAQTQVASMLANFQNGLESVRFKVLDSSGIFVGKYAALKVELKNGVGVLTCEIEE